MRRTLSRAAVILLISMMCFSVLFSANLIKILPAHASTFLATWSTYNYGNGVFDNPTALSIDSLGNVYVADSGNGRIEKFDNTGNFMDVYGPGHLSPTDWLTGVAVDGQGNVYVSDWTNNFIAKFGADGSYMTWGSFGTGDGQFKGPSGIEVGPDGYIYVLDSQYGVGRVEVFDNVGNFYAKYGVGSGPSLPMSGDVAVDSSGNVYVPVYDTTLSMAQVVKFGVDGTNSSWGTFGTGRGQLYNPWDVAVDSLGYVYVTDTYNSRVEKFDSSGVWIAEFGTGGTGDGQFRSPQGIAVDSSEHVYVVDSANNRITVFQMPRSEFQASYRTGAPSIDGSLGAEWDDANSYAISLIPQYDAPSVSATVYFKHDGINIYIGLKVLAAADFYDQFIVYFDEGHNTPYGSGARDGVLIPDQEDVKSALSDGYILDGCVAGGPGAWTEWGSTGGFQAACVFVTDHWECEFSIPFVGNDGPSFSPDVSDLVCGISDTIGIKIQYFTNMGGGNVNNYHYPAGVNSEIATYTTLSFASAQPPSPGITVINTVVGGIPPDAWNYRITNSTGAVVDSFGLAAGGGDTHTFATSGGEIFTITATPKYGYDTAISFQTDSSSYAYPDEILPNVVTVVLAAGGWATVTFSNAAVYSPGPGYTYGSLNGVIPADLTFPFPVNKAVPVQSAWPIDKNSPADGKLDLVVNKTMAVLVNVTDASIGPSTSVTVSVTFDGAVYTNTTATGSAQSQLIAIYPIVPKNLGDKTITGTYQVGTGSPVALTSTVVTVRNTNVLKLFFAYFTPKQLGNYAVVAPADFAAVAANITTFINATYPMKQVVVNATYTALAGNATASSQGGAKNDLKYLANVAKLPASGLGTDAIGVAIVPDNYFTYQGYPAGVVGAMVTPSVKAAVVSQSWYTAAAHEVAHVLYSVFYPKEYYSSPSLKGTTKTGVWADKGQWRSGWDVMDYMGPADGNWIGSSLTYTYLFKNATKSIADPEILFASGSIYQDGTVKLDSWFQEAQGTPDTVVPGNYALNFSDQNGNSIAVTNFDASFNMEYVLGVLPGQDIDPNLDGNLVSDSASFAFATELPEGTVAVQVVNVTDPSKPVVLTTINRNDIPVVGPPPAATVNAYFTDSNFKPIGSFDVLFKPTSSKVTTLTLTATNPATYYYTLDFKNNGAALSSVPITVNVPADFVLSGRQPVQVDFSPVSYTFANGNLAVAVPNVGSGHVFTLRVHLDYKLKGKTGYLANSPTTYSKAYTFDTTVSGASVNAPSVNAVGKTVTAIGGFVADTRHSPQGGLRVKVYKGLTAKWSGVVDGDGYYFVEVSSGGPYSIVLYDSFSVPVCVKTGVNVAASSYVPVDLTVLPISCAIQGFVMDSLGNPVSGVSVQLKGPLGNIQTTTTATNPGGYYVFRFILPGTYTVKITVPAGYTAVVLSKNVSVKSTYMATVNFVLAKK